MNSKVSKGGNCDTKLQSRPSERGVLGKDAMVSTDRLLEAHDRPYERSLDQDILFARKSDEVVAIANVEPLIEFVSDNELTVG